jgi:hypothetical protein
MSAHRYRGFGKSHTIFNGLITMKPTFISKLKTLIVISTFVLGSSCQNEENVTPDFGGRFTIKPLTDQKIIAEIQAMASGRPISSGRTAVVPPVALPPGYNYSNMEEVIISGTSWVTYVAYSTTNNTSTNKDAVGIIYQGGQFKNYLLHNWQSRTVRDGTGSKTIYYHRVKLPEFWCPRLGPNLVAYIDPKQNTARADQMSVYPPGMCGQSVLDCLDKFYNNQGWTSVGLYLATYAFPSIGFGAVAGCAVGCMLHGPTVFLDDQCPQ